MADDESDSFTEVTTQGWGSRISGALGGMVVGLILFLIAFPLLFWNEGRAVDTARALAEGRAAVISVESSAVVAANEGRLVHLTGQLATPDRLAPAEAMPEAALKLRREVEVYQWEQNETTTTEKDMGGGTTSKTTYSYKKVWSSSLNDSSGFRKPEGHQNPTAKPLADSEAVVRTASVGGFRLTGPVLNLINDWRAVPDQALAALAKRDMRSAAAVQGEWAFSGKPDQPRIGDWRVGYSFVPLSEVSVVARQSKGALEPYPTSNGEEVVMAQQGQVSADRLFKAEEEGNAILTWALRVGGFVVMAFGIGLFLRPLSVLGDVLPLLGDLLGAGTAVIAMALALCLSLITIATAWIFFRPLVGIPLLIAGLAFLAIPIIRRRRAAATVTPSA
ncbi:MAG: TMEM43 family protein [Alphaproteobacteria bacterium]|nr:TMEM43 family protein [Alphaproteobacteria bacterium]